MFSCITLNFIILGEFYLHPGISLNERRHYARWILLIINAAMCKYLYENNNLYKTILFLELLIFNYLNTIHYHKKNTLKPQIQNWEYPPK